MWVFLLIVMIVIFICVFVGAIFSGRFRSMFGIIGSGLFVDRTIDGEVD